MKDHFREGDLCARLGGEEFGLFLSNCSQDQAHERLDALRARIAAWCRVGDRSVTISVGYQTSKSVQSDATLDQMLKNADSALYRAKENGRDRVERADPS